MMLKRKKRFNINVEDTGSLNDIAFLLIIFFIVIATFNTNKGFILGLPQKNSSKIVNVEEIIKIVLTKDNKLLYKDESISLSDAEKIVSEKLKIRPNMTFLLKIEPEAKYQDVVNIVDVMRKLNIDNFSFSMIEE